MSYVNNTKKRAQEQKADEVPDSRYGNVINAVYEVSETFICAHIHKRALFFRFAYELVRRIGIGDGTAWHQNKKSPQNVAFLDE